jgi:hypothetical protein
MDKINELTFKRYEDSRGKPIFAAQTDLDSLDVVRTVWKNNLISAGDFLILQADGRVKVVDELYFGDTYRNPVNVR